MKINYITNLPLKQTSGGWSGINFRIYNELIKHLKCNYVGPINPKANMLHKTISKARRIIGVQGDFYFFSEERLKGIANQITQQISIANYNFFFGQTPWIKYNSDIPYGAYIDAGFDTYVDVFSKRSAFTRRDLMRISRQEECWLQGAKHLFMGSQWAWDEMVKHYDLDEQKKIVVWVGGNVDIPDSDSYQGGINLLFISLDFRNKGGYVVFDVFRQVRRIFPKASLTIIGERPPDSIIRTVGVRYAGLLRKHIPDEYQKFKEILSKAFLLIHPTKKDTMGAVIIEAGYFGCPAIASNSFGIPELLIDNQTGYTIDNPDDKDAIAQRIIHLISNKAEYTAMRNSVRKHAVSNLTYNVIGSKLKSKMII